MKIINKYIYKELIAPFFFGVAAFTGIFVGTNLIFDLTEYHTKWGVDTLTLIQLFFLSLPEIIVLTFPMAALLGTIMAFNRLSGDSEITAMRSGGISIFTLILPALIMGLVTSAVTIGITEFVVPGANYRAEQIIYEFKHGEKRPETQYDLFLTPLDNESGRPDYILYAHKFDSDDGTMSDVVVQSFDKGSPQSVLRADADYIIMAEARDATAFYIALEVTDRGTRRSKMTAHFSRAIDFPYNMAKKICEKYQADLYSTVLKVTQNFNYVFEFIQLQDKSKKRLKGIYELRYDSIEHKVTIHQICKYRHSTDDWCWKYDIGEDKRIIGEEENYDAFKMYDAELKRIAEKYPMPEDENHITQPAYNHLRR